MMNDIIRENRKKYLEVLRSGKYKKGTIKSDELGKPIIESPEDNDGSCACAIMIQEFSPEGNFLKARLALGISALDCTYIQRELNDTKFSFPEIADAIEEKLFK